jgi:hypothetical protein
MSEIGGTSQEELVSAVKIIDELVNEAMQVYELDREKTNVIDDLYNSLKTITGYLGFSIDLDTQMLNLPKNTRAVLIPSLEVLIITPNFKTEQKRLDKFSLDEISNILKYSIPIIINMARKDRIEKNQKLSFIRETSKRLPGAKVEDMVTREPQIHAEGV